MTGPLVGETVSGAVEAGTAELALVRPFVGVDVHVLAKVRPRVKALRRFAKFALKKHSGSEPRCSCSGCLFQRQVGIKVV